MKIRLNKIGLVKQYLSSIYLQKILLDFGISSESPESPISPIYEFIFSTNPYITSIGQSFSGNNIYNNFTF